MTTKVDLIQSLKELQCQNVLLKRENWVLVCDEPFRSHFSSAGFPRNRLRLLNEVIGPRKNLAGSQVYVVCTDTDETPHVAVIKELGGQALGLFSHILPRLIAQAPPRFNATGAPAPATCYALISLPRTGSTVLAQELQNLGIGIPTEHIRTPLIEFARHRSITNFDLFNWWKVLTRSQTRNDVFGTKIIWDFLRMFREHLVEAEDDWFLEELSKFKFFYLVRRDKIGQAVSDYVARATGVWHKWREDAGYEDKLKKVTNEQTNIKDVLAKYNMFCASEDKLRRFLDKLGATVTEISFEQICESPRLEAAKIGRALGFDISDDAAKGPPSLERTTSARHEQIAEELRARLAKGA